VNQRLNHQFTTPAGDHVPALLARPAPTAALGGDAAPGARPGLVLVQEVFGVSPYLAYCAERLHRLGYVVLAPDLYCRIEQGVDLSDRDLDAALHYMAQLDVEQAVADVLAAYRHLRQLEGTSGVGLLGFCLGGTLAYHAAATADPDVCISYYGSAIPDALPRMAELDCPALFHFGGDDEYTPIDAVDRVREAAALNPNTAFAFHPDGGHAFDNAFSDPFHQPRNACAAWGLTAQFLERHLPAIPAESDRSAG
jgi:carboxymethylenebutenolidase